MSKQNLTHKNKVTLAHKSKNRARFICESLNARSDVSAIEAAISERTDAKSVRVNKYAKSIVVEFDKSYEKIL